MTFGLRVDKDLILKKKSHFYLFISCDNQLHSPKHHDSIFGEKKVSSPAERWQEMCSQHIRVKLTTELSLLESMSIILTTKGQL